MRLYRSKGHIWTGTEADAKAANDGNKGWDKVDVPTDKPNLIAWLNENAPGIPPMMVVPAGLDPVAIEEALSQAPPPKIVIKAPPKVDPWQERRDRVMNGIWDRMALEELIGTTDKPECFALIEELIALRRKELADKLQPVAPLPAPRVRTRMPTV